MFFYSSSSLIPFSFTLYQTDSSVLQLAFSESFSCCAVVKVRYPRTLKTIQSETRFGFQRFRFRTFVDVPFRFFEASLTIRIPPDRIDLGFRFRVSTSASP